MKFVVFLTVLFCLGGQVFAQQPFIRTHQHFSPMLTAGGTHGTLANFVIVNTKDCAPVFLPELITAALKKKGYTTDVSDGPNRLYRDGSYMGKILLRYHVSQNYGNDKATYKVYCVWSVNIYDVESSKPVEAIKDSFKVPGYDEEEQLRFIREKIAAKLGGE